MELCDPRLVLLPAEPSVTPHCDQTHIHFRIDSVNVPHGQSPGILLRGWCWFECFALTAACEAETASAIFPFPSPSIRPETEEGPIRVPSQSGRCLSRSRQLCFRFPNHNGHSVSGRLRSPLPAQSLGVTHVRYSYNSLRLSVDMTHPRFVLDHNRCILCTRCVRVCTELEGANVWEVASRGIYTRIVSDLRDQWWHAKNCTACGECVQACPTGALAEKGYAVHKMVKQSEAITRLAVQRTTVAGNTH